MAPLVETRVGSVAALARAAAFVVVLVGSAGGVHAQEPTPQRPAQRTQPRRQETIEIRGRVPTPQVVTVRPREAPAYSRRVLVPAFFDRDFWPSIVPPLQIMSSAGGPTRADSGTSPRAPFTPRPDSLSRPPADSLPRRQPAAPRPPPGTSRAPRR